MKRNTSRKAEEAYLAETLRVVRDNVREYGQEVAKMQEDIDILQLKIATNVTANPFSVTFESLDGLTVAGVWNADLARIEF